MPRPKHRETIVRTAARLFRRQGYAATGVNQIVEVARAPKGSLYHHFPGGKDEIAEAAVQFSGAKVAATLRDLAERHESTRDMIRAYGRLLAGWVEASGFSDGCPITTTLLETAPASEPITKAGREAFDGWRAILTASLIRDGLAGPEAERKAALVIAALEGGLILARVEQSTRPIEEVFAALSDLLHHP